MYTRVVASSPVLISHRVVMMWPLINMTFLQMCSYTGVSGTEEKQKFDQKHTFSYKVKNWEAYETVVYSPGL